MQGDVQPPVCQSSVLDLLDLLDVAGESWSLLLDPAQRPFSQFYVEPFQVNDAGAFYLFYGDNSLFPGFGFESRLNVFSEKYRHFMYFIGRENFLFVYYTKMKNIFFCPQDESPPKKRKLNNSKAKEVLAGGATPKKPTPDLVRRSARARQLNKGRQMFVIDKFTTLKDLKIKVIN